MNKSKTHFFQKFDSKKLLLCIVLLGLVLRLVFFKGVGISDSLVYSKTAATLEQGIDPDSVLTLSTRLGLILPTRFSYSLFGINDFSSVIFILLTSVGNIILIYLLGSLLFDKKTGLIASFLMAIFPLEVVYSSQLLSDLPSAFFVGLGIYVFLLNEMKDKWKYFSGYILSGIFIGVGYLIRESALLIALFFALYVLAYKRKIRREYFFVPIGVLIIFILESFLFLTIASDPFYRNNASQTYLADAVDDHNFFGRLDFPTGLLHYPYIILTSPYLSLFYILFGLAIMYCLLHNRKKTAVMMLWFIPILLYLSFGTASITQYIPFRAVDRYLSIITIPGILLLSFSLTKLTKNVSIAAVLLIAITPLGFVAVNHEDSHLKELRKLQVELNSIETDIFMDTRSRFALEYLYDFNLPEKIKKFEPTIEKGHVVINEFMIRNLKEARIGREFPDYVENQPGSWTKIKTIGKSPNEITIYSIS